MWITPCSQRPGETAGIGLLIPSGRRMWVGFAAGAPEYPDEEGVVWPASGVVVQALKHHGDDVVGELLGRQRTPGLVPLDH